MSARGAAASRQPAHPAPRLTLAADTRSVRTICISTIFLSHSHDDKSFVRKFGRDIQQHGHYVWIDGAEMLVGDSLIRKIGEDIKNVDYVAAIISSASISSEWVKYELVGDGVGPR